MGLFSPPSSPRQRGLFTRPDRIAQPLYVVTAIFNPQRYRTRWALYEKFAKHIEDVGAVLYTVELAFGERAFSITDPGNPQHIQVRTGYDRVGHELWYKEQLQNIGASRLPADWRYVMFCDSDIMFTRHDIVGEVLHQLQRYHILQPFTEAQDLDHNYRPLQTFRSFGWCYNHQDDPSVPPMRTAAKSHYYVTRGRGAGKPIGYWHPGYCLAFNRFAFDAVGGLIDFCVLGGADTYMLWAVSGKLGERTMPRSLGPTGVRWLQEWQKRAEQYIRRNVGYVDGLIVHNFHGRRSERGYEDRGQILVNAKFDPEKDIYRDWQGVWQLRKDNIALRDGIRKYMARRNEDAID